MIFLEEEKYKNSIGIYIIENTISGLIYVGQTREGFQRRYYHHRWKLRAGTHDNRWLQASFNKYGEQVFIFKVAQEVNDEDILNELEIQWIQDIRKTSKCCNMLDGGDGRRGVPLPEYRKRELGELNRALNTGKKASSETKAKMSAKRKGKKRNPKDIQKMIEARTAKFLDGQNMKTAKLSCDQVKEIKVDLMNNISFQDIAEKYGISASNVNAIRSNRSWTFVEVEGWTEYCRTHLHNTRARQSRSAN